MTGWGDVHFMGREAQIQGDRRGLIWELKLNGGCFCVIIRCRVLLEYTRMQEDVVYGSYNLQFHRGWLLFHTDTLELGTAPFVG